MLEVILGMGAWWPLYSKGLAPRRLLVRLLRIIPLNICQLHLKILFQNVPLIL